AVVRVTPVVPRGAEQEIRAMATGDGTQLGRQHGISFDVTRNRVLRPHDERRSRIGRQAIGRTDVGEYLAFRIRGGPLIRGRDVRLNNRDGVRLESAGRTAHRHERAREPHGSDDDDGDGERGRRVASPADPGKDDGLRDALVREGKQERYPVDCGYGRKLDEAYVLMLA